jgi:hypothetical protein
VTRIEGWQRVWRRGNMREDFEILNGIWSGTDVVEFGS